MSNTESVDTPTLGQKLWFNLPLWQKIVIGMILGITVGLIFGEDAAVLKPIGSFFVNTIKMLIVPLVFCSIIVGITSMQDTNKMGRIGFKAVMFYLISTAVAITIGLVLGHVLQPGAGLGLVAQQVEVVKETSSLVDTLVALVPTNPVSALAQGHILQIIVFAVALGVSLTLIGEKGKPAVALFESLAEAMYKLTDLVMKLAPYGVFALMAWVAGKFGLALLLPLVKVIGAVYLGSILHVLGVYSALILFIAKLSPVQYFRGIVDAQVVAFTTTSSAGTLPVSMKCARENLGVSKGVSSFVLPLGTTINMDGTALYQGVTTLFVAQAFGIDLGMPEYITIILTATLASIGTAGVPGAGLI
ncbi:MAG: dicarboxylate/amino acid:cation symporter, partial [Moritella sp.]